MNKAMMNEKTNKNHSQKNINNAFHLRIFKLTKFSDRSFTCALSNASVDDKSFVSEKQKISEHLTCTITVVPMLANKSFHKNIFEV